MAATTAQIRKEFGLGDSPQGLLIVDPSEALSNDRLKGQSHYIRRAFVRLKLDGVICIDDIPTVFLKRFRKPVSRSAVNDLQQRFWNLGTGTLLVVLDPTALYVFSSMVLPSDEAGEVASHAALVEKLELVSNALDACQFLTRVANGRYYQDHSEKFKQINTVDQHLLSNLGFVGNKLSRDNSVAERKRVHAFLGRIIFTCYLVDRVIVELKDYSFIRKKNVKSLLDLLTSYDPNRAIEILYQVFERLRVDFNGSMFETDLEAERATVIGDDIETLVKFLRGGSVDTGQASLGFWAYDFASVPVETISAIYEKFLEEEDAPKKDEQGAFYTPRHLAEMIVDEATSHLDSLSDIRCLDPACGSGIFLVVMFNRIAEEYRRNNPNVITRTRLNKLVDVLELQICGVDVNLTACRIACFSLYIAYLDQFDSKTLKELQQQSDKILPNLLAYHDEDYQNTDTPVIYEGNFFDPDLPIRDDFDVLVGNPPWVGRNQPADNAISDWVENKDANPYLEEAPVAKSKRNAMFIPQKQIAHTFMWKALLHLSDAGKTCLLLPVQVLLNKTDEFQNSWFSLALVDRVFNLSDFRHFLFQGAIRPATLITFRKAQPFDVEGHSIEHVAPKARRQDPRAGLIRVFPEDRKWIPQLDVISASNLTNGGETQPSMNSAMYWKSILWGSPRDVAFIGFLSSIEKLSDVAGKENEGKRWIKGVGFQPWYEASAQANPRNYGKKKPIPGNIDDAFIPTVDSIQMFVIESDTIPLRSHLRASMRRRGNYVGPDENLRASLDGFRRAGNPRLFSGSTVVVSKGFSKFAFCEFPAFFEDSLTGIAGLAADEELLRFFTAFIGSKLAKYFIFHTASSLAAERDQVFVHELMRVPFPLPNSPNSHKDAAAIVKEVSGRMKKLQTEISEEYANKDNSDDFELSSNSLAESRRVRIEKLQTELEPLVHKYFKLTRSEIIYVEDTCNIIAPSATPTTPSTATEATRSTTLAERRRYADVLCKTLNKWSKTDQPGKRDPTFYFTAEVAQFSSIGMCLLTIGQADQPIKPIEVEANGQLTMAVKRITASSTYEQGSFSYLRSKIIADGKKIHILKQDMLSQWMRTSALNDADQIFHAIVRSKKK